jgi:hypothetical protein
VDWTNKFLEQKLFLLRADCSRFPNPHEGTEADGDTSLWGCERIIIRAWQGEARQGKAEWEMWPQKERTNEKQWNPTTQEKNFFESQSPTPIGFVADQGTSNCTN